MAELNLTLIDILERNANDPVTCNQAIILVDQDGNEYKESYKDLFNNALKILTSLQGQGLKKGDKVILQLNDNLHFIQAFWGCILGGIIPVPLTVPATFTSKSEAFHKLINVHEQLGSPVIIVEDGLSVGFDELYTENNITGIAFSELIKTNGNPDLIAKPTPDDIAYFQYSSGSTGTPKGVTLKHKNVLCNLFQIADRAQLKPYEISSGWMPLTHDMGLVGFHLVPTYVGMTHFIFSPETFIKKPFLYLEKIGIHKIAILASPNFALLWQIDKIKDSQFEQLDLSSIRLIFNGAEPISMDVIRQYYKKFKPVGLKDNTIYQVYGMAEACLAVTMPEPNIHAGSILIERHNNRIGRNVTILKEKTPDATEFAIVGTSVNGVEVKILDDYSNILKENHIGNIVIKGTNVFEGYFKQKEAQFTSDGFFYTGDLGFLHNGNLIITGRKKDILFVNGQNYYAHDIEGILDKELTKISSQAIVGAYFNEEKSSDDILVFVRFRKDIKAFISLYNSIQDKLFRSLGFQADYIIPIRTVPKTTSGKPQRFKLVEQFREGFFTKQIDGINAALSTEDASEETEFKTSELHEVVISFAEKAFDVKGIKLNDKISRLCVDSIKLVYFVSLLQKELKLNIPLTQLFHIETIGELCDFIDKNQATQDNTTEDIFQTQQTEKTNLFEPFDLTEVQAAYLMGRQSTFEMGGISTHGYYELETTLDIKKFEQALNKVIQRQPMLRAIVYDDGRQQVLKETPYYPIVFNDYTALPSTEVTTKIEAERDRMSHFVFKNDSWPLFEFKACKVSATKNYLFVGFDLLIFDGSSMLILLREIMDYYNQPELIKPEFEYHFSDYINSYQSIKKHETYKKDRDFWMNKVSDFPPSAKLPLIQQPEKITKTHFERVHKSYSKSQFQDLKQIAQTQGVTPSAILCTIFADILSKWSNQEELAINLTVFNRYPFHPQVNDIIGDFTSVMPIEVNTTSSPDFWYRVKHVQESLFDALEHRTYSGIDFIREIVKEHDLSGKAVMPIVFTSMLFGDSQENTDLWNQLGELKFAVSQTPQVYLDFQILENNNSLNLSWDYIPEILDKSMIEHMFAQYSLYLDAIMKNELHTVSISKSDSDLLVSYNNSEEPIEPCLLHQMIDEQVEKTPLAIAVKSGESSITFQELGEKSNQIAHYLKEQGFKNGDYIGVLAVRCPETIINMVGILKAGCAYVPIDPEYPETRKDYILKQAESQTLLQPELYNEKQLQNYKTSSLQYSDNLSDIAYAIFTSGSTGKPKGVVISHDSVSNTIIDINQKYNVTEQDKIIGLSSMCFDLSVYDIFGALTTGAQLVMVPGLLDVNLIKNTIIDEGITIWNSVPAIMDMLMENMAEDTVDIFYWQVSQHYQTIVSLNDQLRLVMLSGDWIPLALPDKIRNQFQSAEVISLGGATEASIWSIYFPVSKIDENWNSIPYGYPLANQTFYVLDHQLNECPVGVSGEMYIGGVGVAKGYLNDPEKTQDAFINHPRLGYIYKTGDYGTLHSTGYIEFQGRKDHQVKIRGHRIELGEIENSLTSFAGIKSAIVIDRTDSEGKRYLCAYYVQDEQIDQSHIKTHLQNTLPDYMVPSALVPIQEIPVTSNGKVDRKNLPEPNMKNAASQALVMPRTETERKLASIWQTLLKVEEIGIDDSFFELGGDSLKGARLISYLQKEMNAEVPLREVFQKPTIREIAKLISQSEGIVVSEIAQVEQKIYYDVSTAQRRMYVLNKLEKDNITYNTPLILNIEGEFDQDKLKTVLAKLVDRHDSFRTSFEMKDGKVLQKINNHIAINISYSELTDSKESKKKQIREYISKFIKPFDLSRAPLFRVALIREDKNKYTLMLDSHHIISDGISKEIIIHEFTTLYNGGDLPELKLQYKDFAAWQNEAFAKGQFQQQAEYWRNQFKEGVPQLEIPTDFQRPSVQNFKGDNFIFDIDKKQISGFEKIKKESDITLYMFLLGALNILLSKFANSNDIIVGSPVAGRQQADLDNIIGVFVNTLVLRNQTDGNKSVNEFLHEVKENVLASLDNQDYPFEELVEDLQLERDISRNPMFDVLFALQNMERSVLELNNLKISTNDPVDKISKLDLSVYAYELDDKIRLVFEYATALFTESTIEKIAKSYQTILEQISKNPDIRIKDIEAIDKNIEKKLLLDCNNTSIDYSGEKTIPELFEEQTAKTPDAIALTTNNQKLTYAELNEKSNQIAYLLRKKGVQPENIVGIMVDRSLEMMIGILGIMKSGAAYLPIDPEYPSERIAYVIEDSATEIILSQPDFADKIGNNVTLIDITNQELYHNSNHNLAIVNTSSHLAYQIYTSGTTGNPKGVMISHKSLHNFIIGICDKIEFKEGDRILAVTTVSFDIFALETILSLCKGLTVVVAQETEIANLNLLRQLIKEKSIGMLQFTPSRLKLLMADCNKNDFKSVHTLMVGGEAFPQKLLDDVKQVANWKIYNMYGPTETTIWSTISNLTNQVKVNIGNPIANTQIYILNKYGKLCPPGVTGELCIGGDGLAQGYHNRKELTEEKFVTNKYTNELIYKTGDLARWLPDGNIECLGRTDHQIKLRGYRIELGEIENRMLQIEGIKEAAATVHNDKFGDQQLCGYFVSDKDFTIKELRDSLIKSLPEYMVPAYFSKLESIPLTPNGKINRKALPEIIDNIDSGVDYIPPRNETEQRIHKIWQEVLGLERIGVNDSFFEIGGNSLAVVNLSNLLSKEFNQEIEVTTLFSYHTISSFSEYFLGITEHTTLSSKTQNTKRQDAQKRTKTIQNGDIAIIGMSGRFPKAKSISEFWDNIYRGDESITFYSDKELIALGIDKETLAAPNYVKASSIIEGVEYFDANFFGYTPGDAMKLDPQVRIFEECAWEALEDAGYNPEAYTGKIGVFAGASSNFYWQQLTYNQSRSSVSDLFNTMQLNDKQFLPTQVSYRLNLKGPAVYVNTACSTSLVAIHMACQSIQSGECQMAMAGAVSITQTKKGGYQSEEGMILSKDGHCRSFDKDASGTIFGNGAGIVILKSLEDAIQDRDNIYAVIKGSAVNNDGKDKTGYTAPAIDGQRNVIEEALQLSGLSSEKINFVEAHGTGTPLGDPIEIESLIQAYNTDQKEYCAIGSVKSNIGHLDVAAGAAGFIKSVLAVKSGILPASINYSNPNPQINFSNSPFFVNTKQLNLKETNNSPIRAGVSSFGIGGTNSHIIIEEKPVVERVLQKQNWNLLILSAQTQSALKETEERLIQSLLKAEGDEIEDIAYTLGVGRKGFKYRKAVVCQNRGDAVPFLQNQRNEIKGTINTEKKDFVFMFSGQGSQYFEMGKDLYHSEPVFRDTIDYCLKAVKKETNIDFKEILYGNGIENRSIDETEFAQPLLLAFEYALACTLIDKGIEPKYMIGHSIGEYTAAVIAGVISLDDALLLVTVRGKLMQEMPRGCMISVELDKHKIKKYVTKEVSLAATNSTNRCVLSGSVNAIEKIEKQLSDDDILCIRLKTSHAYHSPMMQKAAEKFRIYFDNITLSAPKKSFYSNISGNIITDEEAVNPEYWTKHLLATVDFESGINKILSNPNNIVIEVGPGKSLTGLVKEHGLFSSNHIAINVVRHANEKKHDQRYFLEKLAQLWVNGAEICWEKFYKNSGALKVSLPTYPFERKRYWPFAENDGLANPLVIVNTQSVHQDVSIDEIHPPLDENDSNKEEDNRISSNKSGSATEQRVIKIVEEIFKIKGIGKNDNFFELGGDSLKAVIFTTRLHKEFNISISVQDLFDNPTIQGIANYLNKSDISLYSGIEPAAVQQHYTVSSGQKRFFVLNQIDEYATNYNITEAVEWNGYLNKEQVQQTIDKLVDKHEALRTSFQTINEEPYQTISNTLSASPIYYDIQNISKNKEEKLDQVIQDFIQAFDLKRAPLFRIGIIQVSAQQYVIVFDMHHIIADGVSMGIIVKDFISIYNGDKIKKSKLQFKDFVVWQEAIKNNDIIEKQAAYWQNKFHGYIPVLDLPTDYARPELFTSEGNQIHFELDADLKSGIESLMQKTETTLSMILLSALNILLSKYSNQQDIVIGMPVAGRPHSDLQDVVGMFINTIAIRNHPSEGKTIKEFISEVKANSIAGYANQDYPFEDLVEKVYNKHDASRNPLFDIIFVMQDRQWKTDIPKGIDVKPFQLQRKSAMVDISFVAFDDEKDIKVMIEYCTKLYKEKTIRRFIKDYTFIIKTIINKPDSNLKDILLTSEFKVAEGPAIDVSFNFN